MSNALVGMLRGILSLETSAFEKGASAAEKRAALLRKNMLALGKSVRNVGAGLTAAITAPMAGLAHMSTCAADAMIELDNQARIAGVGIQQFKVMSLGARTLGIEQDKLADILKDVNDKVGDFLQTGAGPMADFFDNIAPKVGVTAEQFRGLNSADALQLYISSLERAKVSQQEMTFYMEAIASDATALIPLFRDNGAAIDEMSKAAEAMGMVLNSDTIQAARKTRQEFQLVGEILKTKLQASLVDLMPVFLQLAEAAIPVMTAITDKIKALGEWFKNLSPKTQKLISVGAAFAAMLGPLAMGLGVVVMTLAPLAPLLAAVISPLGLLAIGAAVAGVAIVRNWDTIKKATFALAAMFPKASDAIYAATVTMAEQAKVGFGGLLDGIRNAGNSIKALFDGDWPAMWQSAWLAVKGFGTLVLSLNPIKPLVDKVVSEIRTGVATIGQAIEEWWTGAVLPALTAWSERAIAKGEGLVDGINNGIAAASASVSAALDGIWDTITTTVSGWANGLVQSGRDLIDGYVAGIREKAASVKQVVRDMILGGRRAAQEAQDSHSPSRVYMGLGQDAGQGYADGISATAGTVSGAAATLVNAAVDEVAGGQGSVRRALDALFPDMPAVAEQAGQVATRLRGAARAGADVARELGRGATGAVKKLADEFDTLRRQLDPAYAASKDYESAVGTLTQALKAGIIGQSQFNDLVGKARAEMSGAATDAQNMGQQFIDSFSSNLLSGDGDIRSFWQDIKQMGVNSFTDILKTSFAPGGAGIKGVAQGLSGAFQGVMGAFSAGGGGLMAAVSSAMPILGAAVGVFNLIKGFYKTEKIGSGIQGSISGNSKAQDFEKVKKSIFWGLFSWTKTTKKTNSPLTKYLSEESSMIRRNVGDLVKSIGGSTRGLSGVKQSFKFDTRGMSAKEIREELQVQLQAYSEKVAKKALGSSRYIRDGESATDALQRLSQALPTVNSALELLDKRLFKVSVSGADLASSLAEMFGGLEGFTQSANFVFQNFYSAAERTALMTSQFQRQIRELGLAVPKTRDEFRKLLDAQNLMTTKGRETYAALLKVAPAFAEITGSAAAVSGALQASRYATRADFEFVQAQVAQGNFSSSYAGGGTTPALLREIFAATIEGNNRMVSYMATTAREARRQSAVLERKTV